MFSSGVFVFYAFICFTVNLQDSNCAVEKSKDSRREKENYLFINKNSFKHGNLIFAVCNTNSSKIRTCNVIQKLYPKEKTRTCIVTLKGDQKDSRLNFRIGINTLGNNKAILRWGDNYKNSSITKITIIDFETCKMNEVTIADPEREILLDSYYTDKLITYNDDSFDLFFNDSKVCGTKLCVISISNEGSIKYRPLVSNLSGNGYVVYISSIDSQVPSKGFAHLMGTGTHFILSLVQPDGTQKQLGVYDKTARPTVLASQNVVSACTKANDDSGVNCTQYDQYGNIKFTTSIPVKYKNTQSRALYNLADGGMLVMLAQLVECSKMQNCNETNYHMVRIAPDGKIMGTIRTEEFDIDTNHWYQGQDSYVYQYGDSEYCAVLIGQDPILDEHNLSNYEIRYHCVTENEFLV